MLSTLAIMRFPLPPVADQAVLFLWYLASMQMDALDVARAGTSKRDLLDFTGTAARHRLVGPADCLAGGGELWPDAVADEVNRLIGTAARNLTIASTSSSPRSLAHAAVATSSTACTSYADAIDVFLGADPCTTPGQAPGAAGAGA